MTVEQVREVVVHLTHYVGWPISSGGSARAPPRRSSVGRALAAADATDG